MGFILMTFISSQTGVELAGLGFSTTDGKEELIVGNWDKNTTTESYTPIFNIKGTVMFDVHTHPIGKDNNPGLGNGVVSGVDYKVKTNYPAYYIISQRNGLTQYFPSLKETIYPNINTVPNSLKEYYTPPI